ALGIDRRRGGHLAADRRWRGGARGMDRDRAPVPADVLRRSPPRSFSIGSVGSPGVRSMRGPIPFIRAPVGKRDRKNENRIARALSGPRRALTVSGMELDLATSNPLDTAAQLVAPGAQSTGGLRTSTAAHRRAAVLVFALTRPRRVLRSSAP